MAERHHRQSGHRKGCCLDQPVGLSMDNRSFHLERIESARCRRRFTGYVPSGISPGHGCSCRGTRKHRRKSSDSLARRLGEPRPPRDCHTICPRRSGAGTVPAAAQRLFVRMRRCRDSFIFRSRSDPAIRLCAGTLRLPRSAFATGDRGNGRRTDSGIGAADQGR